MSIYNPRVDFAFKKLFSEDTASLMALINAVLPENEQIQDITVTNPFHDQSYPTDKLSVLDIKAIDRAGRHYDIEMQVTDEVHYSQRALYYWSKLYASQLKIGEDYSQLRKTIGIHLLNFNCLNDEPDYHNTFHLLNAKTYRREFEDIELHFIELKKFDKDFMQLESRLDYWTSFLTTADRYTPETMPSPLKDDPEISRVMDTLVHLYFNEAEREVYEARLKWLRDEQSAIKSAEIKGILKGREQGLEEGHEQGLVEGLEKGREQGLAEGREAEKRAIAKNMLAQGLDKTTIAALTKLRLVDIETLV